MLVVYFLLSWAHLPEQGKTTNKTAQFVFSFCIVHRFMFISNCNPNEIHNTVDIKYIYLQHKMFQGNLPPKLFSFCISQGL